MNPIVQIIGYVKVVGRSTHYCEDLPINLIHREFQANSLLKQVTS